MRITEESGIGMRERMRRSGGLWAVFAVAALAGGILLGAGKLTAWAESSFLIEAQMLPSDKETYEIRVTVENPGPDWEGTVRLMVDEDYRKPSAYDTVLSLAQGSRKQFVVQVPTGGIESTDGTVVVTLLDKKGGKTAEKEFRRLLVDESSALSMGILSDNYAALTYLDMGGSQFYYYGDNYPIRLVELNQDNLEELLDELTFLVVDRYHTDILTDEQMQEIKRWNDDGGVLIVGTGAYAEDTLSGFDEADLGLSCKGVHKPGETVHYSDSYRDFSSLTLAELEAVGYGRTENDYIGGWPWSVGDGSMAVLSYSLTELGQADQDFYLGDTQENFVMSLLEEVSRYANARYAASSSQAYQDMNYNIRRMLGVLGNSHSTLQFGVLKALVIGYVILVGPILYLVLRLVKKRELYWAAVPVMALAEIGIIFLAGRGVEVVSTKVYSVTVENLSDRGGQETYLYCYDASHREWDLRMAEGYEYAGPLENDNYNDDTDSGSYYYHMKKEGDTLYVGMKPTSNFEDSYFYVSGSGRNSAVTGEIEMKDLTYDWLGVEGTVTNRTDRDLEYFAVILYDTVYVFGDLPAGTACNLVEKPVLYEGSSDYLRSFLYNFLNDVYRDGDREKTGALSALGVGICSAASRTDSDVVMVIGVTEDWENTVDDTCSEISYGCLYTVQ